MRCYKCESELSYMGAFCAKCGKKNHDYQEMIKLVIDNNEEAKEEMVYRATNIVYYSIKALIKNEYDREDIMQECFIKIINNIASLKDSSKFESWVKTLAANTARDWLKKNKPIVFSEIEKDDDDYISSIEDTDDSINPNYQIESDEADSLINELLDELSDKHRLVISMNVLQDMSIRDISESLGCSEGTVKSRLHYAKESLKDKILELRKKGVSIFTVSPIALLRYLFQIVVSQPAKMSASDILAAVSVPVIGGATVAGVIGATGGTVAKAGGLSLATKIIAAVASTAFVAGGIIGGTILYNNSKNQSSSEPITSSVSATIDSISETEPNTEQGLTKTMQKEIKPVLGEYEFLSGNSGANSYSLNVDLKTDNNKIKSEIQYKLSSSNNFIKLKYDYVSVKKKGNTYYCETDGGFGDVTEHIITEKEDGLLQIDTNGDIPILDCASGVCSEKYLEGVDKLSFEEFKNKAQTIKESQNIKNGVCGNIGILPMYKGESVKDAEFEIIIPPKWKNKYYIDGSVNQNNESLIMPTSLMQFKTIEGNKLLFAIYLTEKENTEMYSTAYKDVFSKIGEVGNYSLYYFAPKIEEGFSEEYKSMLGDNWEIYSSFSMVNKEAETYLRKELPVVKTGHSGENRFSINDCSFALTFPESWDNQFISVDKGDSIRIYAYDNNDIEGIYELFVLMAFEDDSNNGKPKLLGKAGEHYIYKVTTDKFNYDNDRINRKNDEMYLKNLTFFDTFREL